MSILHSLDAIQSAITGISGALAVNGQTVHAVCGESYRDKAIQPPEADDVVARMSYIALRLRAIEEHIDHDTELLVRALSAAPQPRARSLDVGSQVPGVIGERAWTDDDDTQAISAALHGFDGKHEG